MTQPGGMPPGFPPMTVQNANPPAATPSKMSGGKLLLIILAIFAALAVPVLGILAALGIYGTKKYISNAKLAEGQNNVVSLAKGVALCAGQADPATGKSRGLPGTSLAVPATLAEVKGIKYQSAPGEWGGDPAFACAGFRMFGPQYFQYRWERRSDSSGSALAIADLDGDGSADATLEQPVSCSAGGACTLGVLRKTEP